MSIYKKTVLVFLLIFVGFSCDSDDSSVDEQIQEPELSAEDFSVTINESPESGLLLGNIDATTNDGELNFSIIEQIDQTPFSINEDNGELRVENNLLFNFEVNQSLTATVLVKTRNLEQLIGVVVSLNDTQLEQERLIERQGSGFRSFDYFYQGAIVDRIFKGEDMAPGFVNYFIFEGERVAQRNIFNTENSSTNKYLYSYDGDNRITEIQFEDELDPNANYTYVFNYNGNSASALNQETAELILFTFNVDGSISTINFDQDSIELEYEDSNLISETIIVNGIVDTRNFAFDNLKNPENHPRFEYVKKVQFYTYFLERLYRFDPTSSTYTHFYSLFQNKNNVIQVDTTLDGEEFSPYIINYNYNLDDYPTKILDPSEPYNYIYAD